MTEEEARAWVGGTFGAEAVCQLDRLADAVCAENERQNLIAPSTVATIWSRHIADSAQLVPIGAETGSWLDIGTGAGFPGLVVAILRRAPIILVEPRRQRTAFLQAIAAHLELDHVTVFESKVEHVNVEATVISARAVAPVEKLLQAAAHCATTHTRWLLPRGASGQAELAAIKTRWRGVFHMKQSLTEPSSSIMICDGPSRR